MPSVSTVTGPPSHRPTSEELRAGQADQANEVLSAQLKALALDMPATEAELSAAAAARIHPIPAAVAAAAAGDKKSKKAPAGTAPKSVVIPDPKPATWLAGLREAKALGVLGRESEGRSHFGRVLRVQLQARPATRHGASEASEKCDQGAGEASGMSDQGGESTAGAAGASSSMPQRENGLRWLDGLDAKLRNVYRTSSQGLFGGSVIVPGALRDLPRLRDFQLECGIQDLHMAAAIDELAACRCVLSVWAAEMRGQPALSARLLYSV